MKRLIVIAASLVLDASVLAVSGVPAVAAHKFDKPVITSVVSSYGATVGYTHVIINGRRLNGTRQVTFGGTPAANVHVLSSHALVAFAPSHAHGTVQVRVRTKSGTSPTSNRARYTYVHQVAPGTWHARLAPVPSGEPADDFVSTATSCPTTTACYSVGYYSAAQEDPYTPSPLVSTRISGEETTERSPLPAGVDRNNATLYAISCPAVGSCVAAGQYDNGHHSFVLVLANGTWTASTADLHEGTNNAEIHGLSCGAPGECVAVGYQTHDYIDSSKPVVLRLHNGAWTTTDVVAPRRQPGLIDLDYVDCASANYCLAAGTYGGGTGGYGTYVVQVLDGALTVRSVPNSPKQQRPSGAGPVQCPAVGRCTMLVDFAQQRGNASDFVSVGNGNRFTFEPIAFPADADLGNTLFAYRAHMSCPAVSVCYAAGSYEVSSGYYVASVVRLSGTKVHFYNLPYPAGNPHGGVGVSDIDCATTTACTAVGSTGRAGTPSPGEAFGAYFTFANSVWTTEAAHAAPGQHDRPTSTIYHSVECPAAGVCTASGDYAWDVQTGTDDGFPYRYYAKDSGLLSIETPN